MELLRVLRGTSGYGHTTILHLILSKDGFRCRKYYDECVYYRPVWLRNSACSGMPDKAWGLDMAPGRPLYSCDNLIDSGADEDEYAEHWRSREPGQLRTGAHSFAEYDF